MEALKLIPVIFSISTYNCTRDYFNEIKLGENYKPFKEVLDICAFVRSDSRHDEDLRDNVHLYINNCTQELNKVDCTGVIDELLKSFNNSINEVTNGYESSKREGILGNENCIRDKLYEAKVYNNFLKFFTYPENFLMFWNETDEFKKSFELPIELAMNICTSNEIYGTKFEKHKDQMKNLSQLEPCHIQYLIDGGFVIGKLPEVPEKCEEKNKQFLNTLNASHLKWNYPFRKYFTLERNVLIDCFIEKTKQHKLLERIIGIEYSYALQLPEERDDDETKKEFIELRKSADEFALACHAQV